MNNRQLRFGLYLCLFPVASFYLHSEWPRYRWYISVMVQDWRYEGVRRRGGHMKIQMEKEQQRLQTDDAVRTRLEIAATQQRAKNSPPSSRHSRTFIDPSWRNCRWSLECVVVSAGCNLTSVNRRHREEASTAFNYSDALREMNPADAACADQLRSGAFQTRVSKIRAVCQEQKCVLEISDESIPSGKLYRVDY